MPKSDVQTALPKNCIISETEARVSGVLMYLGGHVVTCLERDWSISMSDPDVFLLRQDGGGHLTPHIFVFNPDALGIYQTSK
jgi:hypothetical protein